jgi:ribose transport system ATP-binding protein
VARGIVEQLAIKVPRGGEEPAAALSGGNQQKVVLGKWLQVEPKVLILDEPTRGVDVGAKEQIYRELRALTDEGLAVLVISSELVEVLGLSDRVLVMASGRIVGQLEGDNATEENVMALITKASPHPTAVAPA